MISIFSLAAASSTRSMALSAGRSRSHGCCGRGRVGASCSVLVCSASRLRTDRERATQLELHLAATSLVRSAPPGCRIGVTWSSIQDRRTPPTRQEAVGDVSVGQHSRLHQRRIGDLHTVVQLVAAAGWAIGGKTGEWRRERNRRHWVGGRAGEQPRRAQGAGCRSTIIACHRTWEGATHRSRRPRRMEMVSVTEGWSTYTCWKRLQGRQRSQGGRQSANISSMDQGGRSGAKIQQNQPSADPAHRSKAGSFSMYCRYSSRVVAPMQRSCRHKGSRASQVSTQAPRSAAALRRKACMAGRQCCAAARLLSPPLPPHAHGLEQVTAQPAHPILTKRQFKPSNSPLRAPAWA